MAVTNSERPAIPTYERANTDERVDLTLTGCESPDGSDLGLIK